MNPAVSPSERQLVVFTLHGDQWAVPIESVREIVQYRRPTATAAATGVVQGLISLRGEVLPVADLSGRLGRDAHPGDGAQIVVLALNEGSLGLIVDHVEGVRHVPAAHISSSPVPGAEEGLGEEIAAIDDVLVLLIDPERVLGGILRRPAAKKPAAATKTAAPKKPAAARKSAAPKKPAAARKPAAPKKPAAARKPAAPKKPAKPRARRRPPSP